MPAMFSVKPLPNLSTYDQTLLASFSDQLERGNGLTEKQATVAERILTKYSSEFSQFFGQNIDPFLQAPKYKLGKRVINQAKTVKLINNKENVKVISVAFPYNDEVVNKIKTFRTIFNKTLVSHLGYVRFPQIDWNTESRSWIFSLREDLVNWVYNTFQPLGFEFDQEILDLYENIENIKNSFEQYVPMVVYSDNSFKYINTHENIPQPTSTDLLEVLFNAKKYGIFCWDESIDIALNDKSINHFTKKLLRENTGTELPQNGEKLTKADLKDTIDYFKKILVTIPGGSELESLRYFHKFMKDSGIPNENMSVLFRLDSSSGTICNDYVKTNNLNNPISDKIKIFFISGKVPKPLISAGVEFDAIINLGGNSAHYTQKNLVKNHHCVINYTIERDKINAGL